MEMSKKSTEKIVRVQHICKNCHYFEGVWLESGQFRFRKYNCKLHGFTVKKSETCGEFKVR